MFKLLLTINFLCVLKASTKDPHRLTSLLVFCKFFANVCHHYVQLYRVILFRNLIDNLLDMKVVAPAYSIQAILFYLRLMRVYSFLNTVRLMSLNTLEKKSHFFKLIINNHLPLLIYRLVAFMSKTSSSWHLFVIGMIIFFLMFYAFPMLLSATILFLVVFGYCFHLIVAQVDISNVMKIPVTHSVLKDNLDPVIFKLLQRLNSLVL